MMPLTKHPTEIGQLGDMAPPLWHGFQLHTFNSLSGKKIKKISDLLNFVCTK